MTAENKQRLKPVERDVCYFSSQKRERPNQKHRITKAGLCFVSEGEKKQSRKKTFLFACAPSFPVVLQIEEDKGKLQFPYLQWQTTLAL